MSGLASIFSSMVRDPDEFTASCDHCCKVTTWKLMTNLLGQQLYKCLSCGKAWNGRS